MSEYYGVKHKTGNFLLKDIDSGQIEIYETKKDAKRSFTCLDYIVVKLKVSKEDRIKQLEEDKRLLIKFLEKEESYILDELAEKRVPSYVAILNSIKTELNKHLTP